MNTKNSRSTLRSALASFLLLMSLAVILSMFSACSDSDSSEDVDGDTDGDVGTDGDVSGDGDGDSGEDGDSDGNGDGDDDENFPDGDYEQIDSEVVLNEIDCQGRDWVELYNKSNAPVDLGNWIISDNLDMAGHLYYIPEGEIIPANGFYVIKEQKDDEAGFTFGIKCGADFVYVVNPDGQIADNVGIGALPDDTTWGRVPDGSGQWQETAPTQGESNKASGPAPDDSVLFGATSVVYIDLQIDSQAESDLTSDAYTYTHADFTFSSDGQGGDSEEIADIGIRLKSGSSYEPLSQKAAFKLRFNKWDSDKRFFGLKNITLNNMVEDASMMHETLAYKIFRENGLPAPRTGYVWVTVNGEDYGLYVVVEKYDDIFTGKNFKSSGHVYEGSGVDLQSGLAGQFEVDEGDKEDVSDLENLINLINNTDTSSWSATVGEVADLTLLARMWALELYLNQIDGYVMAQNNYFLHSDSYGYFCMMPWGMDRAFSTDTKADENYGVFYEKCQASSECKARYDAEETVLLSNIASADYAAFVAELKAAIDDEVEADPRHPYTAQEYENAVLELSGYFSE